MRVLAVLVILGFISNTSLAGQNEDSALEVEEAINYQKISATENLNYILQEQAPPIITQKKGEDTYFELRSQEDRDPSSAL